MKKFLIAVLATSTMTVTTHAGTLSLDMRADYNSTTYDKSTESDFTKFYFKTGRLDYQGKALDNLSYRARIAFNKNADTDLAKNKTDSTPTYVEYAYLSHKMNDYFTFTAGKFNTELGGFEGGTSSADLYLTSEAYSHKGPNGTLASNLFATTELLYMTGAKATFTTDGQTFHILATNESESKSGSISTQNSSLWGAIWRGAFIEKALNINLSYHTVNGAAKDDKFQMMDAGVQWNSNPVIVQVDYLANEYKEDASGKKDTLTSVVGKVAYTGWESWTPRLELTSSEEKLELAANAKNKFMSVGAVLEYTPYKDTNFRYHLAYSNVKMEPETSDNITKQEVVVGARLMADFLK